MKILSAAEMKEVDQLTTARYHVRSLTLMETAGKSVAEFIQQRFPDLAKRRIVVLCGKGNNGGDGFVVARHLLKMGAKPAVHLFGNPREVKGDAATNLRRWKKLGKISVDSDGQDRAPSKLSSDSIVVDALLGTGARGAVRGRLREAIERVNTHEPGCTVVAVDIPSGLNADTGEAKGAAIVSDFTITFTAPKPGLFFAEGTKHSGQVIVRDVGTPPSLIEEVGKGNCRWSEPREFSAFARRRHPGTNKGDYGHALVISGSIGKTGAAMLASCAALRAGAGLVTLATPEPALPIVAAHTPEVMTQPLPVTDSGAISSHIFEGGHFDAILKGKRALGIGPGLSTQSETQEFIRTVVANRSVPIILDADGLNAFAGRASELKNPAAKLCLTPHPGEMARLAECTIPKVQAHRVELALKCAARWNAYVILKGNHTITAAPDGRVWINSTGNPGMGTGGTGDVLTGILTGLTAQYRVESWPSMLAFGVYLHGLAGDIPWAATAEAPLMASDLITALPLAYRQFYSESER